MNKFLIVFVVALLAASGFMAVCMVYASYEPSRPVLQEPINWVLNLSAAVTAPFVGLVSDVQNFASTLIAAVGGGLLTNLVKNKIQSNVDAQTRSVMNTLQDEKMTAYNDLIKVQKENEGLKKQITTTSQMQQQLTDAQAEIEKLEKEKEQLIGERNQANRALQETVNPKRQRKTVK